MPDEAFAIDVEAFAGMAQLCPSCRTEAVYAKNIAAVLDSARRGLESIYATRCFGCGDVRLIGTYWSHDQSLDLRAELDQLAAIMSEIAAEECHGTRQ
jgi:hypothetical protein